jgi:hypothetical protein
MKVKKIGADEILFFAGSAIEKLNGLINNIRTHNSEEELPTVYRQIFKRRVNLLRLERQLLSKDPERTKLN